VLHTRGVTLEMDPPAAALQGLKSGFQTALKAVESVGEPSSKLVMIVTDWQTCHELVIQMQIEVIDL